VWIRFPARRRIAIIGSVPRALIAVATGFGSGLFPVAPATFASALVTAAVWWLWPVSPAAETILIAALLPVAVWIAGAAERHLGHDAHPIVIDEVAGQLLALWMVPREAGWMLFAFFLFRLFDVWKPLGIYRLQRLPGGFGVVSDDVLAGLYARTVLLVAGWLRRVVIGT
jgi:phosphatidylglycerophosphatase A